ncbi:unnamed protein product [Ectocarpus sp. 12 AP-2014]
MESECREFAVESFKCIDSVGNDRERAKDACGQFFERYKECLKRESDALKKAQREGPPRRFFG